MNQTELFEDPEYRYQSLHENIVVIVDHPGTEKNITISSETAGYPVREIGKRTFCMRSFLESAYRNNAYRTGDVLWLKKICAA